MRKGPFDVMAVLNICAVCGRICDKPGVDRCQAHRKDKMRPRTPNRKATMGIGAVAKAERARARVGPLPRPSARFAWASVRDIRRGAELSVLLPQPGGYEGDAVSYS